MPEERSERQPRPRLAIPWPAFRDWFLLAAVLVSTFLYFPLNHGSTHIHTLTRSWNNDLPVVPVFAVPYLVFLPVFWLTAAYAFFWGRDFAMFALSIAIVYFVSDLVYVLYPTYMPRPDQVVGFLSGLVRYVWAHDDPYNDFPSEHASSALLLALYLWPKGRVLRNAGLTLAVLVIPATMLIKQHSVVGAIGGVALAAITWLALTYARNHLIKRASTSL